MIDSHAKGMLFPSGGIPTGPPIQEGKGLLLVDFQNDFVSAEGKLPVASTKPFLPKIPVLAKSFRAKGTVIWCRSEYKQPRQTYSPELDTDGILLKTRTQSVGDDQTASSVDGPSRRQWPCSRQDTSHGANIQDPEAFLAKQKEPDSERPCMPGTLGAKYPEFIAEAIDTANDIDIVKSNYSAFADTALLLYLRMRLITHLYVCGSLSNISVYATVLDAVRHGIQVTLIEDMLGYITESCHIDAIRQMVDRMGAMGIDFPELMDDLAGLLGDVIHESDFTSHFSVSISLAPRSQDGQRFRERVTQQATELGREKEDGLRESSRTPQKIKRESPSAADDSSRSHKSARRLARQSTAKMAQRKQGFTSDVEDSDEAATTISPHRQKSSWRPSLTQSKSAEGRQTRQTRISKPRIRRARTSQEISSNKPMNTASFPGEHSQLKEDPSNKSGPSTTIMSWIKGLESSPHMQATTTSSRQPRGRNELCSTGHERKARGPTTPLLWAGDDIGAGDSSLHVGLLDETLAERCFNKLRNKVRWQKMYHRSGEVPRLVAVQGEATADGDIPIYRHPADESPELLPFDETVQEIHAAAEKVVGHELNHVLIQRYRSGEDSISEHSDKTLDIVRGSKIVNISLGARRTMTLRTKRAFNSNKELDAEAEASVRESQRESQRIHLPHNSIFILGPVTNQYWLHAIRPDKRPTAVRDLDEVAFEGERISLTFRHIGTFINKKENTIWGQGATGKTRKQRKPLAIIDQEEESGAGKEAAAAETIIIAFGRENHQSEDWDWDQTYGQGWDVVNFRSTKGQQQQQLSEKKDHDDDDDDNDDDDDKEE